MPGAILCALLGLGCDPAIEDRPPTVAAPAVHVPAVRVPPVTVPAVVAPAVHVPDSFPPACDLPAHCERACKPFYRSFVAAARLHPSRTGACRLARQACQESRCEPDAQSPAGAMGLCQFLRKTAIEQGIDPWDPKECIVAMAKYDRWGEEPWTPPPAYGRTDSDIRVFAFMVFNRGRQGTIDDQRIQGWSTGCEAIERMNPETAHYADVIERPSCDYGR